MNRLAKMTVARRTPTGFPVVLVRLLTITVLLLASGNQAQAHSKKIETGVEDHSKHASSNKDATLAEINLPEGLLMLNQFGDAVALKEEVIGDKVVVIDFVYTSCTTVCPVVSSILSMVQTRFPEQMGKTVELVSITVDPTRDTPQRLLSYSENFNLGAGWSWLSGDKKIVDKALNAMGAYTPNFEDHPSMVLIGDIHNSQWYRLYGFPAPDAIESKVRELLDNRSN